MLIMCPRIDEGPLRRNIDILNVTFHDIDKTNV